MRLRFLRPRLLTEGLRDLARRRPEEAGDYIDTHHAEWEELVGDDPENAADILEALDPGIAADLIAGFGAEDIGEVLDEMNPEAAADILEVLSPTEAAGSGRRDGHRPGGRPHRRPRRGDPAGGAGGHRSRRRPSASVSCWSTHRTAPAA